MSGEISPSSSPKDPITSQDIAFSLWMVPILNKLVDVHSFFKFIESHSAHYGDRNALALGYCFASCLALTRLIRSVLDAPAVFGGIYDEAVERAFQSEVSFLEVPTTSIQGRMVVGIAQLYKPLLGINSFNRIETVMDPIQDRLLPALRNVLTNYNASNDQNHFPNLESALHHTAIIGLHLFYHDVKMVRIAFKNTFRGSKGLWAQSVKLQEVINKKQKFFEGYKLAVGYLWHSLLGGEASNYASISRMLESTTWKKFAAFYKIIQVEIIDPLEREVDVFGGSRVFIAESNVDSRILEQLCGSYGENSKVQKPSDEERLDRIFLGYPVRLVDHDATASNTTGFIVAVSGATSQLKDKVKVRRFLHGHHFSYAVLITASSNLADYSTWWLFHDFCTDDSGMGSAGYFKVEQCLQSLGNRIELEEHHIDSLILRNYSENHSEMAQFELDEPDSDKSLDNVMRRRYSPSFRMQLTSAKGRIVNLNGMLLELIASTILSQEGFRVNWRYKNSQILEGDSDIDVLAITTNSNRAELIVVECTTAFDVKLVSELNGKIAKVTNSVTEIVRQLDWSISLGSYTVTGLIVTTDSEITLENSIPSNMVVWYRKQLLEKCKAHGIKPEAVAQLFPEKFVPETIEISSLDDLIKFRSSPDDHKEPD